MLAANESYTYIRTVFGRSRTRAYFSPPSGSLHVSAEDSFPRCNLLYCLKLRDFYSSRIKHFAKIYLVSSKHFKKLTEPKKTPSKIKRKLPRSDYDKWIKLSGKLREEDVTRKAQLKDIEKFMKQVLPEHPVQRFERITPPVKRRESLPTAPAEIAPKNRNSNLTS